MRFIDEAIITVRSGKGGDGAVSFRREKFVPRGGPDGGDGGRGGDVVLVADPSINTLLSFHRRKRYIAADGGRGGSNRRTGRKGRDCELRVPVGTSVFTLGGELIADLTEPGQRAVVAAGGKPGKGNARFALPWRQAPDFATKGEAGQELELRLELKLIADIGIIGLPNAGKSTLINRISAAKAKVADYPFTTLVPNLGVVSLGPDRSFVVADMPGLIEGAADGAGLGTQFLRHCERTKGLVHLIDASLDDPITALHTVERELARYGAGLTDKPVIIVASKMDLPSAEKGALALRQSALARGTPFFEVSALTGSGIESLVAAMGEMVATMGRQSVENSLH